MWAPGFISSTQSLLQNSLCSLVNKTQEANVSQTLFWEALYFLVQNCLSCLLSKKWPKLSWPYLWIDLFTRACSETLKMYTNQSSNSLNVHRWESGYIFLLHNFTHFQGRDNTDCKAVAAYAPRPKFEPEVEVGFQKLWYLQQNGMSAKIVVVVWKYSSLI